MKNLHELHEINKGISAKSIFKSSFGGNATAIQLLKNQTLKEHSSKTNAVLICVVGKVLYKESNQLEYELNPGDYIDIIADVKHWLESTADSQLLLIK